MTRFKAWNSIRARLTLTFCLALALFLSLICAALISYARRDAERAAQTTLRLAVGKAQRELTGADGPASVAELREEERDLASENLVLMIVDGRGRVVRKSQTLVPAWPLATGDDWRAASVAFGANTLVIGLPWRRTEQALRRQAVLLTALSSLALALAGAGAWLLVGHTLSPIGRLTRQAEAASAPHLRVRLAAPSQDGEIVALVETLNGLLARVTEATAARGRFYAAASHELRTPLQALSGHLELALRRPRTEAEYQAVVVEADIQTQRLTLLVRDLLLLNQLESAPPSSSEPVDAAAIFARTLRVFAPVIEARGLRVENDSPAEAMVLAAPTHVEMLARNLIENAVKYADTGGRLRLRIETRPPVVCLELFNSCAPNTNGDIEKWFEPFYRPDASRNSETGGNGLGLAICKAVVDANNWKMRLARDDKGVFARVAMRAAEPYKPDA